MRCFVAIELPRAVHERLAALQERLQARVPGVHWTRVEQIHLTIKFLGEVPDGDVPRVAGACAAAAGRCQPFELAVGGAGCFPPRGPARVLWVGIESPPPELAACQQAFEQALEALGFPPEDRPFHPHLTLGRVKDSRAGWDARATIEAEAGFQAGRFTAREVTLFQSVLQRGGPIYTALARAPLGTGP